MSVIGAVLLRWDRHRVVGSGKHPEVPVECDTRDDSQEERNRKNAERIFGIFGLRRLTGSFRYLSADVTLCHCLASLALIWRRWRVSSEGEPGAGHALRITS